MLLILVRDLAIIILSDAGYQDMRVCLSDVASGKNTPQRPTILPRLTQKYLVSIDTILDTIVEERPRIPELRLEPLMKVKGRNRVQGMVVVSIT